MIRFDLIRLDSTRFDSDLKLSGPAYSEGTDLACSLKPNVQFSLLIIVWLTWNQRPCGKRRGPTEEVRQVLGYPFTLSLRTMSLPPTSMHAYAVHDTHMR